MKYRKLAALLLALCLLPAGCSAGGEDEAPPVDSNSPPTAPAPAEPSAAPGADSLFTLCWVPDGGLNPYSCTSSANRLLLPLLYEGLFILDSGFEAQPQLCEDFTVSEDGLHWSFRLLEDLRFSDGSALTAADAEASLRAAKESPAYSGRFSGISEISVSETGELLITLSAPNTRLPCLLDIPIVKSGTASENVPVGTGPYSLVSGAAPRLQAVAAHRDAARLALQEICLTDAAAPTLSTDFEQGLVDLIVTDLNSDRSLSFHGNPEVRHFYTRDLYYLGFNMAEDRYFADAKARADIFMAVDREALLQEVFEGYLTPAALPVHPASALYDAKLAARYEAPAPDLAAYLQERLLGDYDGDGTLETYVNGEIGEFSVDFVVCTEDSRKVSAARSITKTLSAVGYPIALRELDRDDFLSALSQGDFDLYLAETVLSADFDLRPLLGTDGKLNYGALSDLTLDRYLADFRAAGPEEAAEAGSRALSHIAQKYYILPIGFAERALYNHPGVIRGLSPANENIFYGIADWTVSLTAE